MGSRVGAISGLVPRQGQQVLEVLQVLQEGPQVAVDRGQAALGEREEIVPARLGDRLPVAGPRLLGGAHGKRRRAHQACAAFERRQRAVANGKKERFSADIDPAFDAEPPPATQEVRAASNQVWKMGETIGCGHSCSMYSTVEPSKATNAPFTQ